MNRRESILLAVKVLLQKGYEWLACDADGTIVAYEIKPFKMTEDEWWNYDSAEPKFLTLDNAHDINFVKWEDEEPTNIAEWIKKEEEEMNIVTREARFASVDLVLDSGYLWLARDLNGSIAAYSHKPFKLDDEVWYMEIGESKVMWMWVDDGDLYNFVKWEDDEPVNIREWLEKEEEELKLYYVGNGGLLTPKEVELDRDNKKESPFLRFPHLTSNMMETEAANPTASDEVDVVVPDGANMIKVNARNSGKSIIIEKLKKIREALESKEAKEIAEDQDNRIIPDGATIQVSAENSANSAFYEMAEKFREALDMATDYGYRLSVSIVDDNYTWGYNLPILDFKSMDPEQLTLDEPIPNHAIVCQELTETYKKKNADYGNSFANSLDKHGLIAGIIRMDDKMSRLISLNSKKEQQVMDESLRDTLMDLANYAIMSVMWMDDKSGEESDGGYLSPTESKVVSFLDQDSYLLAAGEAFRAGFSAGIIGESDRDIYADNQKLDIDKALREGAHPQAIRDFLGGADYDGDTTNS